MRDSLPRPNARLKSRHPPPPTSACHPPHSVVFCFFNMNVSSKSNYNSRKINYFYEKQSLQLQILIKKLSKSWAYHRDRYRDLALVRDGIGSVVRGGIGRQTLKSNNKLIMFFFFATNQTIVRKTAVRFLIKF